MIDELWTRAEALAARGYSTEFEVDTLPSGQPVYMARNPELPGCKAQGSSIDEAQANLAEARIDYINALLEENLPIPEPRQLSMSGNTEMQGERESTTTRSYSYDEGEIKEEIETDPILYGISLGGDLVEYA
jgi:predicted RNase H-like HicB family nuclease